MSTGVTCALTASGLAACGGYSSTGATSVPSPQVGALAPQHFYRSGARLYPCPLGTWSNSVGAVNALCSGVCTLGHAPKVNATDAECGGPCPAGAYCPFRTGRVIACPPGTFNTNAGSFGRDSCVPCVAGAWCSEATASITSTYCAAGYYGNTTGATSSICTGPCHAGYWCSGASTTPYQVACGSVGVYCPIGSAAPTPVPDGWFSLPESGATDTRTDIGVCRSGEACAGGVRGACTDVGRYTVADNATVCGVCADGWTTVATPSPQTGGFTACQQCEAGAAGTGGTCDACPSGKYSAVNGSVTCEVCGAGTFSTARATACNACQPGQYQSAAQSAGCLPCAAGSTSSQARATTCTDCVAGTYAASPGLGVCATCEPGRFASRARASFCEACEPPYVVGGGRTRCDTGGCSAGAQAVQLNASAGISGCVACAAGSFAPANSTGCTVCPNGMFNLDAGLSACFECSATGLSCAAGVVTVSAGFWPWFSGGGSVVETAICPVGDYCLGTQLQAESNSESGATSSDSALTFRCGTNRDQNPDNALCGRCADGFYEQNGDCVTCNSSSYSLVVLGLLIVCEALVLFILLSAQRDGADMSVALFFAQTALLVAGPEADWLQWLQFINFAPRSAWWNTCVLPLPPFNAYWFALFGPLLFFGLLGVTALVHVSCCRTRDDCSCACGDGACTRNIEIDCRFFNCCCDCCCGRGVCTFSCLRMRHIVSPFEPSMYLRGAVALALFVYPEIALNTLQYLQCIDIGPYTVIAARPAISCTTSEYKGLLAFIILVPLLGIVIGFPVAVFAFLRTNRLLIKSPKTDPQAAEQFARRWGILFAPYKPNRYFWMGCVLVRRTLYTAANLFGSDKHLAPLRVMGFQVIGFGSLLLQVLATPFAAPRPNALETASHALLSVLALLLGAYGATPGHGMSYGVQILVSVLVSVPSTVMLGVVLVTIVQAYCCGSRANANANTTATESPAVGAAAGTDVVPAPPGAGGGIDLSVVRRGSDIDHLHLPPAVAALPPADADADADAPADPKSVPLLASASADQDSPPL